ncbi:hypothetical protein M1K46_18110 [Fictibacillus sp. WQ 8-8]|uniref:hypothetical protein n=1 Tax=Fictibacillus sp. WQ 8-8 TaxID=2938788 RepID=UPI00210B6AB9|nr:hypothetical protein [Fictibacillus sp. WQ 8-8]MCQ6267552.1 hypothetical protein [Fictibacillus sp. WQ 8-8]
MREKWFWAGIILAVLSWIGNSLYYQSKQIEHPIFLKHYYEAADDGDQYLKFYYLANREDKQDLQSVRIKDAVVFPYSQDDFMAGENNPSVEQEYTHQDLKVFTVSLKDMLSQMKNKEAFSFNKMRVVMNNGQSFTAYIGHVTIHKIYKDDKILEEQIASGSNFGDIGLFQALKPITLTSVSLPFEKETERLVSVKANTDQEALSKEAESDDPFGWTDHEKKSHSRYQTLNPHKNFSIKLKQKDWIELATRFKASTLAYCDFSVKLHGTSKGKPFVSTALVNFQPVLSQNDVDRIISKNGGGVK